MGWLNNCRRSSTGTDTLEYYMHIHSRGSPTDELEAYYWVQVVKKWKSQKTVRGRYKI